MKLQQDNKKPNQATGSENINISDAYEYEAMGYETIYRSIERIKMKKLFYLRLTIMLIIVNLLIAINTFGQLVTVNGVNMSNTAQITIKGDMLNNAGTTIDNNGTIDLTGDFTNNSAGNLFGASSGSVELNGGNQNIAGSDVTQFYNLYLSGTGTKTLQQDALVGGNNGSNSGILSLDARTLELNSKLLSITNSSNSAITRTSGYIVSETDPVPGYGIVKWNIKNNTGNYVFPFGNASTNSYIPVTFEINSAGVGSNGSISVGTYPTLTAATPNNRPLPTGLTSLIDDSGVENAQNVVDRWWVMDVADYTTKPVSSITLSYRESEWDATAGSTNFITENLLQAQSNDYSVWTPVPSGVVNTALNTVTVTNVSIYNPIWTLVGSSNPLPIELLTFNAKLNKDEIVDLDWATAVEINNDYYTLEKSKDGINFEPFAYVDGAGNSTNMLYYHEVDKNPYEGTTYYRLKQTDFDGMFSYSDIKAVRLEKVAVETFSVFPNPATDHFFVKFDDESTTQSLFIIDINGKVIREITIAEAEVMGSGLIKVDRLSLVAGMYFVSTLDGKMQKLVIQ